MSEGPEFSWRWLLRLLTLIGILVSIGVALGTMEAKRGELGWGLWLPFAAGLALGDIMPKRSRFNVAAIIIAPFFSTFAVGLVMVAASTHHAVVDPHNDITAPYIVQGLVGALFGIPSIAAIGAIPSSVGAAISSSLKSPYILGFLNSD